MGYQRDLVNASVYLATFTVGKFSSFTITTTGFPAVTLLESGALPAGLHFKTLPNGTATIFGTPSLVSIKTYHLTLTAENGILPLTPQTFTLIVAEPVR